MTNYTLRTGYSYQRWQVVVNAMLEKQPGNPKIHKVCVIHLYEADYNMILGIKWRHLIHHAEDAHVLNPGQYGSRPGCTALDPALIDELQAEISRVSRKSHVKFANDASSYCYDRIIPGLANIASRKYGMNRKVCMVQGDTASTTGPLQPQDTPRPL